MTTAAPGAATTAVAAESRFGAPARRWLVPALAALGVALLAVVLARYSLRLWTHNFDEDTYRDAGLNTAHGLPGSLWSMNLSDRGLQRLESWVFAVGLTPFGAPEGFRVVRLINVACYLSTVVPVWWWARRLALTPVAAALVAGLSVVVPWATITATFMTENTAYPAVTWALFGIWQAAVRPAPRILVLATLGTLLAMLARTVMLVLPGVLVIVVVAVALRCDARAAWARRGSWSVRQTALAAAVALVGLAGLAVFFFDRDLLDPLTGRYTADTGVLTDRIPDVARTSIARVIAGLGIVPGIVGLGWTAQALVRPARRESFALAILTAMTAVLVVYSALRAGPDERYLMYLAPPLLLGAAVAVQRRELHLGVLAGATAAVLWLLGTTSWNANVGGFAYMVAAAETFHARVLRLGSHVPGPLSDTAVVAVGIVLAMAVTVLALGGRPPGLARLATVAVLAGVVVLQVAQLVYAERHFTTEAAWGPPSLDDRAWVDRAVHGHKGVGLFLPQTEGAVDLPEAWRETAFWNLSITRMLVGPAGPPLPLYRTTPEGVAIDDRNGRLGSANPLPGLLVEPRLGPIAPLVGRVVADGGYEPFTLVRPARPARVAWLLRGANPSGWLTSGRPATIRVFAPADPAGACLALDVAPPPGLTAPRTVELRTAGRTQRLRLSPDAPQTLHARLAPASASRFGDVVLRARGTTTLPNGQAVAVRVAAIRREPCPT